MAPKTKLCNIQIQICAIMLPASLVTGCNTLRCSSFIIDESKGGSEVHSLLQLSERWTCHTCIWLVGKMRLVSLEANVWVGWGLLVYSILLFSLLLSGRSPNMTLILLTGTLSLCYSSFNQSVSDE